MKRIHLFLASISVCLCICTQTYAQKNHIEKMILKEKTILKDTTELNIKGQTYIYGKESPFIKNTKITRPKDIGKKDKKGEYCRLKNYQQLDSVYKSIFSKERITELKDSRLVISCILDINGIVKELVFILVKAPDVTLEEINALETALLDYKFELIQTAQEQQHYQFVLQCRFDKLLDKPVL